MTVFGTGGDAAVAKYDQMRFKFNSTGIENPDNYYKGALTCSYYFPYNATAAAEFKMKVVRLSATSVRIFIYKEAQGGNSRVDLYASSTACNNLTNSTNTFDYEIQGANSAGTVTIYNTSIILNKA